MMYEYHLLEILAAGFVFAVALGYLAKKFGLSPIVGYLLAGFIVGPFTPGYVADAGLAGELSEIGVILMMFGVGLHFDTKDLMAVRGVSLPGAIIQSTAATLSGLWVAHIFGLGMAEGLMLGIGLSVASTVVLLRVLEDHGMVDTAHGHVAVGWLVVEDILTVLVVALLPTMAGILLGAETVSAGVAAVAVSKTVLKLTILWVIVLVAGGRFIPWLLASVARTRSQELFTLTILMAAFAISVGSAKLFGVSLALGAFLGGLTVGKSSLSHQAGSILLPMKDAFSALFFVSVGMLFNPTFFIEHWVLVLACALIVLLVKPLAAMFAVSALGYSVKTGLVVAISLSQIGEFSFILAQQASAYNLIGTDVYNILVICAFVTIALNPLWFNYIPKIEAFLRKRAMLWSLLNYKVGKKNRKNMVSVADVSEEATIAVVVGYGPTGQCVTEVLIKNCITPVIIDMNVDTVHELSKNGIKAIYGNSSERNILKAAGIEKAAYLVITLSDINAAASTATLAGAMNQKMRILTRVRFINSIAMFERIGVDVIVAEEKEVAERLSEALLLNLEKHHICSE